MSRAECKDPVSMLQETAHAMKWDAPVYTTEGVTGASHQQTFYMAVTIGPFVGRWALWGCAMTALPRSRGVYRHVFRRNSGPSKKKAKQNTARSALEQIDS